MKKLQQNFWKWYDNIPEPWRMLFAIFVLMSPVHLCTIFVTSKDNFGLILGYILELPILISKIFTNYAKDNTEG